MSVINKRKVQLNSFVIPIFYYIFLYFCLFFYFWIIFYEIIKLIFYWLKHLKLEFKFKWVRGYFLKFEKKYSYEISFSYDTYVYTLHLFLQFFMVFKCLWSVQCLKYFFQSQKCTKFTFEFEEIFMSMKSSFLKKYCFKIDINTTRREDSFYIMRKINLIAET